MAHSTDRPDPVTITPDVGGCQAKAEYRIEVYSPNALQAYGSLDQSVYVCAAHDQPTRARVWQSGRTPYRLPMTGVASRPVCGSTFDYQAVRDDDIEYLAAVVLGLARAGFEPQPARDA